METTRAGAARSLRCPFCHESPDEPGIACGACHARHHAACWGETGRCASCGDEHRLAPVLDPGRGVRVARALGILAGVVVLAPVGALVGKVLGDLLVRGYVLPELFLLAGHAVGAVVGVALGGPAGTGAAALGRRARRALRARRARPVKEVA